MTKLTDTVRRFIKFWAGAVRDPITLDASSSRLIAWGCALVAWGIALWTTYKCNVTATIVTLVTAVLVQGAVALLNRSTSKE